MAAACRAKPDIAVMISHGYGDIRAFGGGSDSLKTSAYGLMPTFIDGMLEGCTPQATVVHGGEATYSHMTYQAFKHYVDVQRARTINTTTVPQLVKKHFRYATALWPDYRSDRDGFDMEDHSVNHFTPDKLAHGFHNAMAASDKYVWTWDMKVHWWPTYNNVGRTPRQDNRGVFPPEYMKTPTLSRQPMDLNWTPGLDDNAKYPAAKFDAVSIKSTLENYDVLVDFKDHWLFALDPDDTDNWGIEFNEPEIYPGRWTSIAIDDYWENKGYPYNGLAWYRHSFTIPTNAQDKRIYAVVSGIKDTANVYATKPNMRGKQVGKVSGKSAAIFDITDSIDPAAENTLTIRVNNPSGPGGLFGKVMIVASKHAGGKHAYLAMRGNSKQVWGHWVKDPRFHDHRTFNLGKSFTVDARVRVPIAGEFLANLWASSAHTNWTINFASKHIMFGDKQYAIDASKWHDYRVVVTPGSNNKYIKTLYIDGSKVAEQSGDDLKRTAKDSNMGWGSTWVTIAAAKTSPKVNMDVDRLRYARRAIVPGHKEAVFEAGPRKENFWDEIYDGDALPHTVGWKYWPEGDPTTISQIIVPDPYNLGEVGVRDVIAGEKDIADNWSHGIVPRDFPLLKSKGTQALVMQRRKDAYAVRLTVPASMEVNYGWPGLTMTQPTITDWSGHSHLALIIGNPTNAPVEISVKIIDQDRDNWYRYFTIRAHERTAIRIPINDLKQKIDPSKILAVGFNRRQVKTKQLFDVSDLYLIK